MKIYKLDKTEEFDSCYLCSKGELNFIESTLLYPYEELIIIEGRKKVVLCPECFKSIKEFSI